MEAPAERKAMQDTESGAAPPLRLARAVNETIAAIATGAGCGIGIVRISGPEALDVAARVFRGRGGRSLEAMPPLNLLLGAVVDPASGSQIDEAFAVHMRAGRSYTGEPTVEIQCHGGRRVLDAVLHAALRAGARPAEPGEFTKRAYLSGRLDLSQAEAVAELIAARTEGERRSALSRLQGALGERVRSLRGRLLDQVAAMEAILDHGDDEMAGLEPDPTEIMSLAREFRELIASGESQVRRDTGPRVVIAGRTNSGKSSIFNVLCDNDRSIVSPIPGTTRDYVEERFTIGGILVTLIDTAGLRDAPDEVESEGIRRTRRQMLEADLLVIMIDGSLTLGAEDIRLIEEFRDRSPLVVLSKSDLPGKIDRVRLQESYPELRVLSLSTSSGDGCPDLAREIADRCRGIEPVESPAAPNHRHQEAFRSAASALDEAARLFSLDATTLDLAVTELRLALNAVGEITGEAAAEELIGRIFSRFCLGK
jgi:tRNA modification GTPase